MTITCNTDLSEILFSEKIIGAFENATGNIKSDCTMPRLNYIGTEIEKSAIKDAIISDSNTMYTSGLDVKTAFENFHTAYDSLYNEISVAATNKEKEELRDLIDKVTKKINSLDDDINDYEYKIKREEDENTISDYRQKIRDIRLTKGVFDDRKTAAIARLKNLGEDYSPSTTGLSSTGASTQGMTYEERTSYQLRSGDEVTINGKYYEFLRIGKDDDGTTYSFFVNSKGQIIKFGPDGSTEETRIFIYDGAYGMQLENQYPLYYYEEILTSEANAAELGLPEQSDITPKDNDEYCDIYVDYGPIDPGESTHVKNSSELHEAVLDPESNPIITMDAIGLEDNKNFIEWFIQGDEDIRANKGNPQITLIYDNNTGKYYPLDAWGGYDVTYTEGLTPKELQKFTINN